MALSMGVIVADQVLSQAIHRLVVSHVPLVTCVLVRLIRTDQRMKTTTMVTSAPRDTIVQRAPMSPKSANLASSTHLKAWSNRKTVNFASLVPSRIFMVRRAARFAAFLLTLVKVRTSASVSEIIEHIQRKTPLADVRVALTI